MRIDKRKLVLAALPVFALGGCAGDEMRIGSASNMGEASRQTFAAQVIDPAPVYDAPADVSGQQVAGAIDRYNTDKKKKPERTSTSNLQSSSTGGGT